MYRYKDTKKEGLKNYNCTCFTLHFMFSTCMSYRALLFEGYKNVQNYKILYFGCL